MYNQSARRELETVNKLFTVGIDYEEDWLRFIGVSV